jgi:hypothetical protein
MSKSEVMEDKSSSGFGKRTLPETLDGIAREIPNRQYGTIPISADLNDGFRDISVKQVANGVNGFAFQLEQLYGRSAKFETITYMGISDLRYVMVVLGAIKCGYQVGVVVGYFVLYYIDIGL